VNKNYRLRKSSDFEHVLKNGRSWVNRVLVLYAQPNQLGHNRYGFAASKRVGNAVARNRAKRLMREAVRLRAPQIRRGWDFVLIARHRTTTAHYDEVAAALARLLAQADLLMDVNSDQGEG
jgi:ribonuclease P protein component